MKPSEKHSTPFIPVEWPEIIARDLPEVRLDMLTHPTMATAIGESLRDIITSSFPANSMSSGVSVEQAWRQAQTHFAKAVMGTLTRAPLYYVSDQFSELLEYSAESLPDQEYVLDADLPSKEGVMLFERPMPKVGGGRWMAVWSCTKTEQHDIVMVLWFVEATQKALWWLDDETYDPDIDGVLDAAGLTDEQQFARWMLVLPPFYPQTMFRIPRNSPPDVSNDWHDFEGGQSQWKMLLSAWLMHRQKLVDTTEVYPPRATLRRLKRADPTHQDCDHHKVRVLQLRQAAGSSQPSASREYVHQWMVRGHWRNQWYPASQAHRPVWIWPYRKGPEGAPMLDGETVHVL